MPLTQQLVDKYQPRHIRDFVGLTEIKQILTSFVAEPRPCTWLFSGAPGLGKTSMALALAADLPVVGDASESILKEAFIGPRLRHYYSNEVNLELVKRIKDDFGYQLAHQGYWTVYLIDEVDEVTHPAHIAFLGVLENLSARAITVFTCNSTKKLPPRLQQRCHHLRFSKYGMGPDLIRFLTDIWGREAPPEVTPPDFARLVIACHNSVRACLMELELRLLALKT